MTTSILTTKLYIPPLRTRAVPRSHLIERLNDGLLQGRKLTLISAPAGFGKTTLLSECAATCGRPVAWVSLDENDNQPQCFWTYVVSALQTVHPGIGPAVLASLQSPHSPPMGLLLTGLINEIVDLDISFVLILNDFHESLVTWLASWLTSSSNTNSEPSIPAPPPTSGPFILPVPSPSF